MPVYWPRRSSLQSSLHRCIPLVVRLAAVTLVVCVASPSLVAAQRQSVAEHTQQDTAPTIAASTVDSARSNRPDDARKHWEVGAWFGSAFDKRSASKNHRIDGEFRVVAVWASRTVYDDGKLRLSLLAEAMPMMSVTSSAPIEEARSLLNGRTDRDFLLSLSPRQTYGVGLSPFGGAATYAVGRNVKVHMDVAAGGVLFTKIVPYGNATRANFTVTPTLALRWEPRQLLRVVSGYKLHHLSNASFGSSNPGMNSHIWFLSFAAVR